MVLILSPHLLACADAGRSMVGREALSLQRRSVPVGGHSSSWQFRQRAPLSAAALWYVESDWNWGQYEEWLATELQREFDRVTRRPGQITLTRWRGEFVEVVQFAVLSAESPLRVQVVFLSRPS